MALVTSAHLTAQTEAAGFRGGLLSTMVFERRAAACAKVHVSPPAYPQHTSGTALTLVCGGRLGLRVPTSGGMVGLRPPTSGGCAVQCFCFFAPGGFWCTSPALNPPGQPILRGCRMFPVPTAGYIQADDTLGRRINAPGPHTKLFGGARHWRVPHVPTSGRMWLYMCRRLQAHAPGVACHAVTPSLFRHASLQH